MSDPQTHQIADRLREALVAADLTEFSELLHPDVRWGAPDDLGSGCQNRGQVLTWYRRGRAAGISAEVTECVVFDSRILIGMRISGRDAMGGDETRWQVFTVGGGQIVEIVGYDNRAEAFDRASQ